LQVSQGELDGRMSNLITIYTDASHSPITGKSSVAFRAKFENQTLVGGLPIRNIRAQKNSKPGQHNIDILALEMFAILYAVRCVKRAGWKPTIWFFNCDNINVCYCFWPWKQVKCSKYVNRYLRAITKYCSPGLVRIKHIKGHKQVTCARTWSNSYCDTLARQIRLKHE
jgi:hypothetical protein